MGQVYKLTCQKSEEASLQKAVACLDEKMCAIRDSGKVKGNDRIAVMAGLAIAAQLLSLQKSINEDSNSLSLPDVKQKISAMQLVLDKALNSDIK
jgi:cell division protein ZapA